ncbi:hypothetical protein NE865_09697 [Phthorimaea operculella]|nr:hypothetical protein NE865_09697 [Phthorimaea operculella]
MRVCDAGSHCLGEGAGPHELKEVPRAPVVAGDSVHAPGGHQASLHALVEDVGSFAERVIDRSLVVHANRTVKRTAYGSYPLAPCFNTVRRAVKGLEDNFNKATEFLELNQKEIKSDVSAATNRIKSLESEKLALETSIIDLNRRIETLEKTSRSRNIEIQAVPEKRSENVMYIVKKIFEVLNVPSPAEAEICSARRVAKLRPESDRPRNILVTLQSERQRDQLISAFRRYNKNNPKMEFSSSSIGLPGPSQRIYLSEHLSSQCKELHYAARKFAKEHSYTYVWIKYGRVYLRKNDNEPAIYIKSQSDFDKLK